MPTISAITNVTRIQSPAQSTSMNKKSTQSKPKRAATAPVQLSSTANSALEEADETSFETDQEAGRGDLQAQRLLDSRGASKKTIKKPLSVMA